MLHRILRRGAIVHAFVMAVSLGLVACSSGGGSAPPPTGTLSVTVIDRDTSAPIANAQVMVIDGASGDILQVLTTDQNGATAVATLLVGQVQMRIAAQGYQSSPASIEGVPLPYEIVGGQNTAASFALSPLADASNLGWVKGRALHIDGSSGVANALITASSNATGTTEWYTTSSVSDGSYVLFNIPAGAVEVSALRADYNFVNVPATVTAAAETAGIDILSTAAAGSLSGHITFLSTTNIEVDVTMLDPETGAVIPGLRTLTSGYNYALDGIPDGTYHAIASLETDGKVLDPDYVAKFGVPQVTVSGGVATPNPRDFSVTGAVSFIAPVNFQTMPVNALTFSWAAYPSTKNYILEMINDNGDVIWGGSAPVAGSNYTVGTATQVTFDPAWASEPLVEGKLYRVRVYASVDSNTAPFYTLISASEDLEGVFQVGPATAP